MYEEDTLRDVITRAQETEQKLLAVIEAAGAALDTGAARAAVLVDVSHDYAEQLETELFDINTKAMSH